MTTQQTVDRTDDLRRQIREEFRTKALAWVEKHRLQAEALSAKLAAQRKTMHDGFMAAALANPAIVKDGMTPYEAARVCLRFADHLMQARRIEEGNDVSER